MDSNKFSNLSKWQYSIMIFIMIFVWALAFPFIKIGLDELSFINLTIMRFFVVCLVLIFILILKPKWFSKLHKKDIFPIFLLGFFGVIVYHLGLNYGEQFISAGAASLIIATIPIFIAIFAVIFLKEKIGLIKIFGILLSLTGVIIISIWGTEDSSIEIEYIFAAFIVLFAAIMGAVYTIAGKKLLERYNGLSLTVYAILLGSISLIIILILDNLSLNFFNNTSIIDEVAELSLNAWFAVLFLGMGSTAVGYIIWYLALEIKKASELSVYLYVVPVLSTIVSYFIFDDKITILYILGGLLVIIGLIIVNKKIMTKN